jgi:hypothetical protein
VGTLLGDRAIGVLLALGAVGFWYEAPTWARNTPRESRALDAKERGTEFLPPSGRTIRSMTVVLRTIAVAVFTFGVLMIAGVLNAEDLAF